MKEQDNQRVEVLVSRALAGHISQRERDELLVVIYRSLWSPEDLDEHILERHREICEKCEIRQRLLKKGKSSGVYDMLAGNKLTWIIVGILVLIIAALLGVDVSQIFHAV